MLTMQGLFNYIHDIVLFVLIDMFELTICCAQRIWAPRLDTTANDVLYKQNKRIYIHEKNRIRLMFLMNIQLFWHRADAIANKFVYV